MLNLNKNRKLLERDINKLKEVQELLVTLTKDPTVSDNTYKILDNIESSIRILKSTVITRLLNLIRQGEDPISE